MNPDRKTYQFKRFVDAYKIDLLVYNQVSERYDLYSENGHIKNVPIKFIELHDPQEGDYYVEFNGIGIIYPPLFFKDQFELVEDVENIY